MKSIRIASAAAAVMSLSIGAAAAADIYAPPPAAPLYSPVAAANWTGLYAGIHGGFGFGNQTPNSPAVFDLDGPFVGAQIGYNWQTPRNLVLGLEADISWSGVDGIRTPPVAPVTTTHDIDWFGTLRGRIGMVRGDWLLYATGGLAFADSTRTNSGGLGGVASASNLGWTAGLGAERVLSEKWTLKGEYKYLDFGTDTYTYSGGGVNTVDLNLHTFQIGLNRRF